MVSQEKGKATDQFPEFGHSKTMIQEELGSDWNRNEWLQVDFGDFLATTIDLRIVLFQAEGSALTN